jgi:hypothetical protein
MLHSLFSSQIYSNIPMKISVEDAYHVGQMVMGRASRRLGVIHPGSPEDKRFRGYFGVSAEVAIEAWEMMIEHDYLPPSPQFLHYMWALAFMRLYPANDTALSVALGGSDPKTIRKYIWPMIKAIYDLDEILVCRLLCVSPFLSSTLCNPFSPLSHHTLPCLAPTDFT